MKHKDMLKRGGRCIRNMILGIKSKGCNSLRSLIDKLRVDVCDGTIQINRTTTLDELDSKIITGYNLNNMDNIMYYGIRIFLDEILYLSINMEITKDQLVIRIDKSRSLYHMLNQVSSI